MTVSSKLLRPYDVSSIVNNRVAVSILLRRFDGVQYGEKLDNCKQLFKQPPPLIRCVPDGEHLYKVNKKFLHTHDVSSMAKNVLL